MERLRHDGRLAHLHGGAGRQVLPFRVAPSGPLEDTAFPYHINQLEGAQSGQYSDPWNDCGPAALVACRYRLTGELWMPDQIRDWMYYDGYKGYTTTNRLCDFARDVWGWWAGDAEMSASEARALIENRVVKDAFIIILTREPAGYFHFTPVTGWDEDEGIVRHNVLGGRRETLTWDEFYRRFAGWVITLIPA